MSEESVVDVVRGIVAEALDARLDDVKAGSILMSELGAESLDFPGYRLQRSSRRSRSRSPAARWSAPRAAT